MALTEEDRLKILELLSRYNLAADEKGVEAMVAGFADDGVIASAPQPLVGASPDER